MIYYTVKDKNNRIKAQFLVCGYENGLIQFIDDSLQGSSNKNFDVKLHRASIIDLKICNGESNLNMNGDAQRIYYPNNNSQLGVSSKKGNFKGQVLASQLKSRIMNHMSTHDSRLSTSRSGNTRTRNQNHQNRGSVLKNYLISFSRDNCILFVRLDTLRIEVNFMFEDVQRGIFACLDFYHDFLVFGCEDGLLRFFFLEEGKLK